MSLFGYNHNPKNRRPSWQDYQKQLHRSRNSQKGRRWIPVLIASLASVLAVYLGWTSKSGATAPLPEAIAVPHSSQSQHLSQKDVQLLLSHARIEDLESRHIQMRLGQQQFDLQTSLDMDLQNHLLDAMDRRNSRYIAVVVMDPDSGRILALAGFNKSDPDTNPCMDNQFPAASIFKIVTAAAAIEKFGFDANTRFFFNGRKHTLYKSQLKQSKNKYSQKISLRDAFAQSVNPVFGKIGVHYLKADDLAVYANGFGFNRPISFEIPVMTSFLDMSDEPYQWAEIACGFNRETLITPLHGVSIASAILNQGRLVQPSIIEKITDENGRTLYSSNSAAEQIISMKTSEIMHRLMAATIERGTARKAFSGFRRDKTLSRLTIGGKTGSINNEQNDTRYDWFVGYAEEKNGTEKIALSILVAHENYIGIKASEYARLSIKKYFQDYFLASARK